jgi:hypothetical protein
MGVIVDTTVWKNHASVRYVTSAEAPMVAVAEHTKTRRVLPA